MTKTEKLFELAFLLFNAKFGYTTNELCSKLECSRQTLDRLKKEVESIFNTEILSKKTSSSKVLYRIDRADVGFDFIEKLKSVESELGALAIINEAAKVLVGGYFSDSILQFNNSINDGLREIGIDADSLKQRVKVLPIGNRSVDSNIFKTVITAVLKRKRLLIGYKALGKSFGVRMLSPQAVILHRDNWYLDAYCHEKNKVRTFLIGRIESATILNDSAIEISKEKLSQINETTYGIFSGRAENIAEIKFTGIAAEAVKYEKWHPDQEVLCNDENSIVFKIPYSRSEELIMDILKWGEYAKVTSPEKLKNEIYEKIKKMKKNYECIKN